VLTALWSGGLALGLFSRSARGAAARVPERLAHGSVYENRAGAGVRTPRDRGLAGVLVSNGRDVVRTGADGRWTLPVEDGQSLFVIKPAHWRYAGRPHQAARFWHYAGAQNDTAPIDFGLQRAEEPENFDVLLVADTQAATREELAYVRQDLLEAARNSGAVFGLHHGDVMGDDLSLLPEYLNIVHETGMPWHHCPGNHDMDVQAKSQHLAFDTWQRLVGPSHYAFEYGKALFIVLNTVEFLGNGNGPDAHRPYRGRIGSAQLQFVRAVLDNVPMDRLVVVSMHIPLVSFNEPESDTATTADRAALLALLAERPHTISFAGHSHTTEHHYLGRSEGFDRNCPHHHHVLTAVCGSWWSGERDAQGVPMADSRDGSPRGHHILSVDGSNASTRFVPAGNIPSRQMRLMVCEAADPARTPALAQGAVRSADLGSLALLADVFDGGPKTKVTLEVAAAALSAPMAMHAVSRTDPYVAHSYAQAPHLCKPWLEACVSSHVWQAPLPAELGPGCHRLIVTATNEFGVMHREELILEVTA